MCDITPEAETFADEVQNGILFAINNHGKVKLEMKITMLGLAIGAILSQLPNRDRDRFTDLLMESIEESHFFVSQVTLQ